MNENVCMAISNVMAILPVYFAYVYHDYISLVIFINMLLASFFSHLYENHKHGMHGYGASRRTSYTLNRWDVVSCWITFIMIFYIYISKYGFDITPMSDNCSLLSIVLIMVGAVFLRVSEYDKYNTKRKSIYMFTHIIWHIFAFSAVGIFYYFLLDNKI